MAERALSFGSVARVYHQHRPGYPDDVVDLVQAHADGDVRRALEVGAGTGKGTVVFARRGIEVVALEPDAEMRTVLLEEVHDLPVQVVGSTFEGVDLVAVGPVDLVFAAAAWHWTDEESRWSRTAAALRTGGVAAYFGAPTDLADPELDAAVDGVEREMFGGNRHVSMREDRRGGLGWPGNELVERPEFADVVEHVLPRRSVRPADDFIAHLSTVSHYLVQPEDRREAALRRIRALLPDRVEVIQDLYVHLARRA